jgi:hypothetical protein
MSLKSLIKSVLDNTLGSMAYQITTDFARIKSGCLVLNSTATGGIKVDEISPAYGFADLKGHKTMPTSGGTAPTRTQFRTGVYAPAYNLNDVIDWEYHLEHSDLIGETWLEHFHLNLPEGCTASGSNLVITSTTAVQFHNRTGSPAPITKTYTITPAQLNSVSNGIFIPTEQIIAQAGGNDTTTFNSSNWRIDDTIVSTTVITSMPTLTGGLGQLIGMGFKDFHRPINGIAGTKYREMATTGSFYGTT